MYFYEIEFNPTDKLVEYFGTYEDSRGERCAQTYCIAYKDSIDSIDEMIDVLVEQFADDNVVPEDDLITGISYDTAQEVFDFAEITAADYESITGKIAPEDF